MLISLGKLMSKMTEFTTISTSEADELRVMVSELNESIACLSKMVMQLQKSIISQNRNQRAPSNERPKKPKIFH